MEISLRILVFLPKIFLEKCRLNFQKIENFEPKEMSVTRFSNPYICAPQYRKPFTFQTVNSDRLKSLSLKQHQVAKI